MKKRMLMAGLLVIAMVMSLLVSCGADSVPEESGGGSAGSSDAELMGSSAGTESSDASVTSSFVSESSIADESSDASDTSGDEPEPAESSESGGADEDPSQPEESSEGSESSAANTSSESETSKQQPTETGSTHKHSYKDTVVKPTCTEKGYTLHKCSCGDSYTDKETDALGHVYTWGYVTQNSTDTTRGKLERSCDRCGFLKVTETYAYNEIAPLFAERVLYWVNYYRKEEGLPTVTLSTKLCEYAEYRSGQHEGHNKEEQQAAADATQCGDFYEYSDTSWWKLSCSEVVVSGILEIEVDSDDVDTCAHGVVSTYKISSPHWKILMNPDLLYMGVGNKRFNCIVMCKKSYDDGYQHTWDFGDGDHGNEWVPR